MFLVAIIYSLGQFIKLLTIFELNFSFSTKNILEFIDNALLDL